VHRRDVARGSAHVVPVVAALALVLGGAPLDGARLARARARARVAVGVNGRVGVKVRVGVRVRVKVGVRAKVGVRVRVGLGLVKAGVG